MCRVQCNGHILVNYFLVERYHNPFGTVSIFNAYGSVVGYGITAVFRHHILELDVPVFIKYGFIRNGVAHGKG